MDPTERREVIVAAALAVALRKGLAATTVRDVAAEMGSSPGLVHHYFGSMDELLATAFERVAADGLAGTRDAVAGEVDAVGRLRAFFRTYVRAEHDWTFQLWLDAWAEARRRPLLQKTSQRLNLEWQQLLRDVVEEGVAEGAFRCDDPYAAAWRVLSLLDGLVLQTVAHDVPLDRETVLAWSAAHAERELALPPGTL